MSKELEHYKLVKARKTALTDLTTKKIQNLNEFVKHKHLNKDAFQQSKLSLQQTLEEFRTILKTINELCFNLPDNEFDQAAKDIETNKLALESCKAQPIEIKCEFDASVLNRKKLTTSVDAIAALLNPQSRSKFKPKDLSVPKWNGDLVILNAWKQQINYYLKLTGLTSNSKQLAILLYQNILPDVL